VRSKELMKDDPTSPSLRSHSTLLMAKLVGYEGQADE